MLRYVLASRQKPMLTLNVLLLFVSSSLKLSADLDILDTLTDFADLSNTLHAKRRQAHRSTRNIIRTCSVSEHHGEHCRREYHYIVLWEHHTTIIIETSYMIYMASWHLRLLLEPRLCQAGPSCATASAALQWQSLQVGVYTTFDINAR